jgi:predicted ATP-dependent endonuclease of OLD family
MSDMWSLIFSAAKEFNVQVFATTHSYDCVQSLATICRSEVDDISEVTIQRIEEKKRRAIPFSEAEIKIAAERQIEVR